MDLIFNLIDIMRSIGLSGMAWHGMAWRHTSATAIKYTANVHLHSKSSISCDATWTYDILKSAVRCHGHGCLGGVSSFTLTWLFAIRSVTGMSSAKSTSSNSGFIKTTEREGEGDEQNNRHYIHNTHDIWNHLKSSSQKRFWLVTITFFFLFFLVFFLFTRSLLTAQ